MAEKGKGAEKLERNQSLQSVIQRRMLEILEEQGWTITRLAGRLKEETPTVWRWLNSKTTMPAWFAAAFCNLLGVEGNAILTPPTKDSPNPARRQALKQVAVLLQEVSTELDAGRVPGTKKKKKGKPK